MSAQPEKQQRLCASCKIHWDRDKGLECPECKAHAFFTMNSGDIGTAMYFEQTSDSPKSYKSFREDAE